MPTEAKIIADSVSPAGHRLTSFLCTFPRIILAEVNTHRMLSRNSASSRAIPVEKMIQRVLEDPYVPTHWGKNQRGMQAERDVGEREQGEAQRSWLGASRAAMMFTKNLLELGIHKQITNRLLEPFMWHTALVTGTEWSNFFHLRDNRDAHPDFRDLAHAMGELYRNQDPHGVAHGGWHLPLISEREVVEDGVRDGIGASWGHWCKVSVGRCARVSYLTHDGKRDPQADVDLCERLLASGHMSPFEHVARPMTKEERELFRRDKHRSDGKNLRWDGEDEFTYFLGNFNGWVQYRKLIPHEHDILGAP